MNDSPVLMSWDGECLRPKNAFWQRRADQVFIVGAEHEIIEYHERSAESHRHYFAAIREAWLNLPENLSPLYPSAEALRKRALIETGYCDQQSHVCRSNAEALKLAAWLRPMDEFAVMTVSGATVTRYTARSQSARAMDKKTFLASKKAVLEWCASLIGTTEGELKNAQSA